MKAFANTFCLLQAREEQARDEQQQWQQLQAEAQIQATMQQSIESSDDDDY